MHEGVERRAYFALLDTCHASLSLKSPHSKISSTTFPSKVIEIASRGISLVTTKVSDVGEIFKEDEAWILPEFSSNALCAMLKDMARRPAEIRRRALAGQAVARARFSPVVVGETLSKFLEAEARPRG